MRNPEPTTPQQSPLCDWMLAIFVAGAVLRVAVYVFLYPHNADDHFRVIKWLEENRTLPAAGQINQAYHPPLYYLIALIPWLLTHEWKGVQFLSLLFSIATLWIIHRLLGRQQMVSPAARPWCLAFASFHPQYIIFSLYISNDSLAILLGALLLLAMVRANERPDPRNQILAAGATAAGLLTKATFLAFLPVLLVFLVMLNRRSLEFTTAMKRAGTLVLLAVLAGGFNFARNAWLFGDPWVSNLSFYAPWAALQQPTYVGPSSIFDVNIMKLVAKPTLDDSTRQSIPLLLYGSFWYLFVPDPVLPGNTTPLNRLGGVIYLAALLPTLLMLAGALRILAGAASRRNFGFKLFALGLTVMNLVLVLSAGLKYDVWSIFHARLLFPSYAGLLAALGAGLDMTRQHKLVRRLFNANLLLIFILFIIYIAIEIALMILDPHQFPRYP